MARKKDIKYQIVKSIPNIIEESKPIFSTIKGDWNKLYFKNENPIVIEIGCGSGEYTLGLAKINPEINYIGIDIKGDRLYKGANLALAENVFNVAFLRTQIENLNNFFDKNETSQIWITFPDPQPNNSKKRLINQRFFDIYQNILPRNGILNIKTDSKLFFETALETLQKNKSEILLYTNDLYNSPIFDQVPNIQTHYEKKYLAQNLPIYYLKARV